MSRASTTGVDSSDNPIEMRISGDMCKEPLTQLNELLNNFSDSEDDDELPNSLYVKNVDMEVFNKGKVTDEFENMFRAFDQQVTFQYFRSFKMVRVYFSSGSLAAQARVQCHQRKVGSANINCYFTQQANKTNGHCEMNADRLQPPKPQRQFLISPPASPPVGWEPCEEATPLTNIELLNAITKLTPGQAHELHPPTEDQPGIVVHICEDEQQKQHHLEELHEQDQLDEMISAFGAKVKIQQTCRPPVYTRSASEGSDDSIDSL